MAGFCAPTNDGHAQGCIDELQEILFFAAHDGWRPYT